MTPDEHRLRHGLTPRTYAEINLDHLLSNYRIIKEQAGHAQVCCVVKADAYGHGASLVVPALRRAGADFFAVSSAEEASDVRELLGERETPILILGYTLPEHVPYLIRENITQTVLSAENAAALASAVPAGQRLHVHIALDTGMNRIGLMPEDTGTLLSVAGEPRFLVTGVFSHLFLADEPFDETTVGQYRRFTAAVEAMQNAGIHPGTVHICNSAALSNFPAMHGDMVRAGISLYGLKPSAETLITGLQPVMTVKTQLSHIHTVHAGERIGYGGAYLAPHDMRVATLPVGYADGYLRAYGGGVVLIDGKPAPVLGRICMDQCMVDLSACPDAAVGDEAVLFGDGAVTADTLAGLAGTISYEVVCCVSKRVPRFAV